MKDQVGAVVAWHGLIFEKCVWTKQFKLLKGTILVSTDQMLTDCLYLTMPKSIKGNYDKNSWIIYQADGVTHKI